LESETLNKYADKDIENMTAAATVTTSRFGPSGSLKKKNSALEQRRAVMPRRKREALFDLINKCVFIVSLTWSKP